jgi:hypothetical protein
MLEKLPYRLRCFWLQPPFMPLPLPLLLLLLAILCNLQATMNSSEFGNELRVCPQTECSDCITACAFPASLHTLKLIDIAQSVRSPVSTAVA